MTARALMNRVLAAFTPAPPPEAPQTPLIQFSPPSAALLRTTVPGFPNLVNGSTPNGTGELQPVKITARIIEQAIDEIDDDPTAGLGAFTKRQLLVDKLLRIFNTAEPSEVAASKKTAAPLLGGARKVAMRQRVTLSKRQPSDQGTAPEVEAAALTS